MIYRCPMCDKTLDGDQVESFDFEGEMICINCEVEKVQSGLSFDDLTGFYQACGNSLPVAKHKARVYLRLKAKFYGGQHG